MPFLRLSTLTLLYIFPLKRIFMSGHREYSCHGVMYRAPSISARFTTADCFRFFTVGCREDRCSVILRYRALQELIACLVREIFLVWLL